MKIVLLFVFVFFLFFTLTEQGFGNRHITQLVDNMHKMKKSGHLTTRPDLHKRTKRQVRDMVQKRNFANSTLAGQTLTVGINQPDTCQDVIGYVPLAPYVEVNQQGVVSGWVVDYLDMVADCLDFSYTLVPEPNESFNGGIQGVQDGVYDTFLGTTLTASRANLVSFSQAYVQTGLVIIVQRPSSQDDNSLNFNFFNPFSVGTWFLILGSVIIYAPIIWILEKDEKQHWKDKVREETFHGFRNGLGNALYNSFSSFSQQGPPFTPRTALGRIYSAVFYFVSLVVIATYTADLAAFLTVNSLADFSISSIDDLRGRTVAVTAQTSIESFVQTNIDGAVVISAQNIVESLDLLQRGEVDAVVEENVVADFILLSKPYCDLTIVGNQFNRGGWGFPFQRSNSTAIPDEFSAVVLSLQEAQVPDALDNVYLIADGNPCSVFDPSNTDDQETGVGQLGGLFFLFALASCCTLYIHQIALLYLRYEYNHFALDWPWNLADPLEIARERKKEEKKQIELENQKRRETLYNSIIISPDSASPSDQPQSDDLHKSEKPLTDE